MTTDQHKSILIAGNAPSLAHIDYSRLPEAYDVYRCNQFYFEKAYHTGRRVTSAFFTSGLIFEQHLTAQTLNERGEYHIEQTICSSFNHYFDAKMEATAQQTFPSIIMGNHIMPDFIDRMAVREYRDGKRITSGIYMCAYAAAKGYRTLYLAGIDFYQKGSYAFESRRRNMLSFLPDMPAQNEHHQVEVHCADYDIQILKELAQEYGLTIYSVCPDSPLSQHFPLAPENPNAAPFTLEHKTNGHINDIIVPNTYIYRKINDTYLRPHKGKQALKDNLWYQLIYHLFRLPRDIRTYLRSKKSSPPPAK